MSEQEQQNPDEQAAQEQAAPPSEQAQPTEQPSEGEPNTVKLKYNGPPGQSVVGLGAVLVPGESYDVPEEMADSLIAGSSFWEK